MSQNISAEAKAGVDDLKGLVKKQRELNDAQNQARRKAWDSHINRVTNTEDLSRLMRELAANPSAW